MATTRFMKLPKVDGGPSFYGNDDALEQIDFHCTETFGFENVHGILVVVLSDTIYKTLV